MEEDREDVLGKGGNEMSGKIGAFSLSLSGGVMGSRRLRARKER